MTDMNVSRCAKISGTVTGSAAMRPMGSADCSKLVKTSQRKIAQNVYQVQHKFNLVGEGINFYLTISRRIHMPNLGVWNYRGVPGNVYSRGWQRKWATVSGKWRIIELNMTSFKHLLPSQDYCSSFSGCNYYTFHINTNQCLLFESCPEVNNCQSCVSGQPGCYAEGDTKTTG